MINSCVIIDYKDSVSIFNCSIYYGLSRHVEKQPTLNAAVQTS